MKLFRELTIKPWRHASIAHDAVQVSRLRSTPQQVIGLYAFIIIATSLFLLFVVSYQMRMSYPDWRAAPEPSQLWLSSLALLLSSLLLQMAKTVMKGDRRELAIRYFLFAGVLSCVFVLVQLWSWQAMLASGYFVNGNPANSFFFLITGVHALHVVGGVVAWCLAARASRHVDDAAFGLSLRLCAVYWHFLFVVWLFLFYMLLVT